MSTETHTVPILGLTCGGGGARAREHRLEEMDEFATAWVNPATETAYVTLDPDRLLTRDVVQGIERCEILRRGVQTPLIADALTRYGLGFLVGTFGMDGVVPFDALRSSFTGVFERAREAPGCGATARRGLHWAGAPGHSTRRSTLVIGLAVLLTTFHPSSWESWTGLTYAFGTLVLVVSGGRRAKW